MVVSHYRQTIWVEQTTAPQSLRSSGGPAGHAAPHAPDHPHVDNDPSGATTAEQLAAPNAPALPAEPATSGPIEPTARPPVGSSQQHRPHARSTTSTAPDYVGVSTSARPRAPGRAVVAPPSTPSAQQRQARAGCDHGPPAAAYDAATSSPARALPTVGLVGARVHAAGPTTGPDTGHVGRGRPSWAGHAAGGSSRTTSGPATCATE